MDQKREGFPKKQSGRWKTQNIWLGLLVVVGIFSVPVVASA